MKDITRMLTLSTGHITKETAELLEDPKDKIINLPAYYTKDDIGWFIYVDRDLIYKTEDGVKDLYPNMPDDLMDCMREAWGNNCEWLCIECGGLIVDDLPVYDW